MYMYPEKFQLFHAISKMLREASQAVREKWTQGWKEISLYQMDGGSTIHVAVVVPNTHQGGTGERHKVHFLSSSVQMARRSFSQIFGAMWIHTEHHESAKRPPHRDRRPFQGRLIFISKIYIRSGALMPSRWRPFLRVVPTALASASLKEAFTSSVFTICSCA